MQYSSTSSTAASSSGSSSTSHSESIRSSSNSSQSDKRPKYTMMTRTTAQETHAFVYGQFFQEFHCDFCMEAIATDEVMVTQELSRVTFPTLPDTKGSFRAYHDLVTREILLRKILKKSRDKELSSKIPQADVKSLLESCQQQHAGVFASTPKCQVLAFRILHNMAEHGWDLPSNALDVFIEECRNGTDKNLPYAAMALGQRICQDPSKLSLVSASSSSSTSQYQGVSHDSSQVNIEEMRQLFDRTVRRLWAKDAMYFLETIMIVLAAKTKLAIPLSSLDLEKIKIALVEVGGRSESEIPTLYSPSESVETNTKTEHYNVFTPQMIILKNIKEHVKTKGTISDKELEYLIKSYNKSRKSSMRNKILQIFHALVLNHQRRFPNQKEFFDLLKGVMSTFEFKLRSHALVIANALAANGELKGPTLRKNLILGKERLYRFALTALSSHVRLVRREQIAEGEWKKILEKLGSNRYLSKFLKDQVDYLLFQLNGELKHLESLLENKEECIKASTHCLMMAKEPQVIPDKIIVKLVSLIVDDPVPEATINALNTFGYLAKHSRKVPAEVIPIAMRMCNPASSASPLELERTKAALFMLRQCVGMYREAILCDQFFEKISICLDSHELISPLCLTLSKAIDDMPKDALHPRILPIIGRLFVLLDGGVGKKIKISVVLGKAAEKGFIFNQRDLDCLIALTCQEQDRTLESHLLQIIGTVINRSREMEWSPQLFALLIGICQTGQDVHLQNAGFLLCHFLKSLKGHVPPTQVFELVTLLSREKTLMIAFLALNILVEKRKSNPLEKPNPIDEKSVKKLAGIMLDERCEIHGDIAQLIAKIADYQEIIGQITLEVIAGLNAADENVMVASITILHKNLFNISSIGPKNIRKVMENLTRILEKTHISFQIRSDILRILIGLSADSEITFTYGLLEQLILLFNDPHIDVRVNALILVQMQAIHWRASTTCKNPLMEKLEIAIVPCLRHGDLSLDALSLLEKMSELRHSLSSATLGQIIRIFFDQTRLEILDVVYKILNKNKTRLSGDEKQFFEMLKIYQVLRHGGEKVQKVKKIICSIKNGSQVIEGVFHAVILILKEFRFQLEDTPSQDNSQELLKVIMRLCETVLYCQRSSPHTLLQGLCKIEEWRLTPENQAKRSVLVAKYLTDNQSVDHVAFSVLEEGFLKDNLFEELYYYLPALDAAVKRHFKVKPETVTQLWEILFLFKDEEALSYSVEILLNVFADSTYAYPGGDCIDELMTLIANTSSVELREKLNQLLAKLNQLTILKENQLGKIYQQIRDTDNFQQQYELCCLLDIQSRKTELSSDYVHLIAAKQIESRFLIEADRLLELSPDELIWTHVFSQLINRIKDLVSRQEKLSEDFFDRLAKLIGKLPPREFRLMIVHVRAIAERQNLSDEVLQKLLLRAEHPLDSPIEILQHHIQQQRPLNSGVLTHMETVLLEGQNGGLRRKVYELLMCVRNYLKISKGYQTILSERLQSLLNAELEMSQIQEQRTLRTALASLYNHVRVGGCLSLGNAETLIFLLNNPHLRDVREIIFKIFDERKSDLPPFIYEKLFVIYKEFFLYEKDHQPLFYAFFKFIFSNPKVANRNGLTFYGYLLEGISKGTEEMTHCELKLLRFLAKQNSIVNSDLSVKVFKFFSKIHPTQHKQFLYLVFEQLIRLPGWSPELLKQFHLFIEQVFPKYMELAGPLMGASPSSFNLLSDLTNFVTSPFSSSSQQFEIPPISDELRPILLTLCDYVMEDERSRGVYTSSDDWREQSEDWTIAQLIKYLPQGEAFDLFRKQFHQYLAQLKQAYLMPRVEDSHPISVPKTTPKVRYRQFLRVLFFKRQEERLDWKEVNEFLGMVCCFPNHSREFISQSMEGSRDWFVQLLAAPFMFSRTITYEQMKELYRAYHSLEWLPEQGFQLFRQSSPHSEITRLSPQTDYSDFLDALLFFKQHDVTFSFIEKNLPVTGIDSKALSNLLSLIKHNIIFHRLRSLAGGMCFDTGITVTAKIRHMWLESATFYAFSLCMQGWNFSSLLDWMDQMIACAYKNHDAKIDIKMISDLLSLMLGYKKQVEEKEFYDLANKHFLGGKLLSPKRFFKYILKHHLTPSKKEKELSALIKEMSASSMNKSDTVLLEQLASGKIKACIEAVNAAILGSSAIKHESVSSLPIEKWNTTDIMNWATRLRREIQSPSGNPINIEKEFLPECLAVFSQASCILYGYKPRNTQLLSILLLNNRTKMLAQIVTGEGKTIIIAMLAALRAIQGKQKYLLTSSSVFAERDAKEHRAFYELFHLTAASNEDHDYRSGKKECYDADIVYGPPSQFEFDYLRHIYSGLNTLGERYNRSLSSNLDNNGDVHHRNGVSDIELIIDEADHVLMEKGFGEISMLSTPMPCMQELNPLLFCIWVELVNLDRLKNFPELEFNEKENPFSHIDIGDDSRVREVTVNVLYKYVETMISLENGGIIIPKHLKDFVLQQAKNWIDSAWLALHVYKKDRHYLIKSNQEGIDCIVPVDFANTGGVQVGTSWGEGLHQFLQIKHSLSLEQLGLVTNYVHTRSFLLMHPHRIGVTGTLGSPAFRSLLKDVYDMDSIKIPTFLPRTRVKLTPLIISSRELWYKTIALSSLREGSFGRVALVICDTIKYANQLEKLLNEQFDRQVIKYTDDKVESSQVLFGKLWSGNQIIIATNLAGRGTDIKLQLEVVLKGGLSVIITSLKHNDRVERQGGGRAYRRGEPGTEQLILCEEDFLPQLQSAKEEQKKNLIYNPHEIKTLRDEEEKVALKVIREEELPKIQHQSELFEGYLDLLDEIKQYEADLRAYPTLSKVKEQLFAEQIYAEELRKVKHDALEEHWGLWLKNIEMATDRRVVKREFENFKRNMFKAYREDTIFENPLYHIRLGNQLLIRGNAFRHFFSKNPLLHKALKSFKKATQMDPMFSYISYYHQAYILMRLEEKNYKAQAKSLLQEMIKKLTDGPLQQLQGISEFIREDQKYAAEKISRDLITQVQQQLQVYQLLINSAWQAIANIEESQKVIEVSSGPLCFSPLPRERYSKKKALLQLMHLAKRDSSEPIFVTFHHLKTHPDVWEQSQMRKTVKKLPSNVTVTITFDGERLYSQRGMENGLRALLPIHRGRTKLDAPEEEAEPRQQAVDQSTSEPSQPEVLHLEPTVSHASSSNDPTPEKSLKSMLKEKMNQGAEYGIQLTRAAVRTGGRFIRGAEDTIDTSTRFIADIVYKYPKVKDIPVDLTVRKIFPLEVLERLRKLTSPPSSSNVPASNSSTSQTPGASDVPESAALHSPIRAFGIGPIIITPSVLAAIRECYNELGVTVWVFRIGEEGQTITVEGPKLVQLTDPIFELYLPKGKPGRLDNNLDRLNPDCVRTNTRYEIQISITRCYADHLENLMRIISNQDIPLTWVLYALDQKTADACLKEWSHSMQLSFVGLSKEDAQIIVNLTSYEHNEATLTIWQESADTAAMTIENAKRSREGLVLNHRAIRNELAKICDKPSFVEQHQLNGYCYLYDVKDQLPMPWRSLVLLTTLSITQIAGGIALSTFTVGFGASFGTGLIAEGVADVVRLIAAASTREFDLSSYVLQKTVSMALALATAGYSTITAAKNTAIAGKAAANAIRGSDEAVQTVTLVYQRVMPAFQKLVIEGAENTAKELVRHTLDSTNTSLMKRIQPNIEKDMIRTVIDIFNKDYWHIMMDKLFAVDAFLNRNDDEHKESDAFITDAERLIVNVDVTCHHWRVLDGHMLAKFEKDFGNVLEEYYLKLSDIYFIFEKKNLPGIPKEQLKRICDWLVDKKIVNLDGEIDMTELEKNYKAASRGKSSRRYHRDQKYEITYYNLDLFDFSPDLLERRLILQTCLDYARCLDDDYYYTTRKLVERLADRFSKQFLQSLKLVAGVVSTALYTAASSGISIAGGQVAKKWRNSTQRSVPDVQTEFIDEQTELPNASVDTPDTDLSSIDSVFPVNNPIDVSVNRPEISTFDIDGDRIIVNSEVISVESAVGSRPGEPISMKKVVGGTSSSSRVPRKLVPGKGIRNPGLVGRNSSGDIPQRAHRTENGNMRSVGGRHRHELTGFSRSMDIPIVSSSTGEASIHAFPTHSDFKIFELCVNIGAVTLGEIRKMCADEFHRLNCLRNQKRHKESICRLRRTAQSAAANYREKSQDECKMMKCLIARILIEMQSVLNHGSSIEPVNYDAEQQKSLDGEIENEFYQIHHTGKITSKLIGIERDFPTTKQFIIRLEESLGRYQKLLRKERQLMSFGEQTVRQLTFVDISSDVLNLSECRDYSGLGLKMQQGSLNAFGYIGGAVIHEIGNTVKDILQVKTLSDIAEARVKCLVLTFAEKIIVGQQMIMQQAIEEQKVYTEMHDQLLSHVKEYDEEFNQVLRNSSSKMIELIVKGGDKLIIAEQREILRLERESRLNLLKSKSSLIQRCAEICGFDPEKVNHYSEQTKEVILEMNIIVRDLCGKNLKELDANISERERILQELTESQQHFRKVPSQNTSHRAMMTESSSSLPMQVASSING